MKKSTKCKTGSDLVNKTQILTGLAALSISILVYLVHRSPDLTIFIDNSIVNTSSHYILLNLYGILGNILPSFAYVFSFILITVGLTAYNKESVSLPAYSGF
jgi:hypothetical protein